MRADILIEYHPLTGTGFAAVEWTPTENGTWFVCYRSGVGKIVIEIRV